MLVSFTPETSAEKLNLQVGLGGAVCKATNSWVQLRSWSEGCKFKPHVGLHAGRAAPPKQKILHYPTSELCFYHRQQKSIETLSKDESPLKEFAGADAGAGIMLLCLIEATVLCYFI